MSYVLMTEKFSFQATTLEVVVNKIVDTILTGVKPPRQFVIAPTGSGKTVMAGAVVEKMVQREIQERLGKKVRVVFVTHSKPMAVDFSEKFKEMNTQISTIDDIENKVYTKTPVLLSNPEKFSEHAKQGKEFLSKWLGKKEHEIRILVMDEGDITHDGKRNQIIKEMVDPNFEICFSATFDPNKDAKKALKSNREKSEILHRVSVQEVIASGLIAKSIEYTKNTEGISFDSFMTLVEEKRRDLASLAEKLPLNLRFKPKVLIVEQSSQVNDRLNDLAVFLKNKYKEKLSPDQYCIITQEIDEQPLKNKNDIIYYIGDQLVGRGWDSPQCYIVVSFKSSGEITIGIQLLGRVARMPFQSHFDEEFEALNKGYVFTVEKHSVKEAVQFYQKSFEGSEISDITAPVKFTKPSKIKEGIIVPSILTYSKEEETPATEEVIQKIISYLKTKFDAIKDRKVDEKKVEIEEIKTETGVTKHLGSKSVEVEVQSAIIRLRSALVAKGLPQDLANDVVSDFIQDKDYKSKWKAFHSELANEIDLDSSGEFIDILGQIKFKSRPFVFEKNKSVDQDWDKTWSRSLYEFEEMGEEESQYANTLNEYCEKHDLYWTKNVEMKQVRLSLGYYPDFIIFNKEGHRFQEYKGPQLVNSEDSKIKIKYGEQSFPKVDMIWSKGKGGSYLVRNSKGQDTPLSSLVDKVFKVYK